MINIKKFGVSGVLFNKQKLKVEPGVTYIYGKSTQENGNGNAVGKSLFATSIAEILYDTPIVGTRQDKSTATYLLEFDSHRVVSKNKKLSVTENGKAIKFRTKQLASEWLKKHFPVSEEEYRTYCFLDSITPHPLVRGTSSQRKEFFTNFFRISSIDTARREVNSKLNYLKVERAKLNEVVAQLKECSTLSKQEFISKQSRYKHLQEELEKLSKSYEEYQKATRNNELRALYRSDLEIAGNLSYKRLEKLELLLTQRQSTNDKAKEYSQYLKRKENFEELAKGIDFSVPIEELVKANDKYQRLLGKLVEPTKPKKVTLLKKVEFSQEQLDALSIVNQKIAYATKFSKGKCFACGQPVKVEDLSKLQEKKNELTKLKQQSEDYKNSVAEYKLYKEKIVLYREEVEQFRKNEEELKRLKPFVRLYNARIELEEPKHVKKVNSVPTKKLEKCIAALKRCLPNKDILDLPESKVVEFNMEALLKLQEEFAQLRVELKANKLNREKRITLLERKDKLETILKNEKALQLLSKAYSDKELKHLIVKSISEKLVELVNFYSKAVLPSSTFDIKWGTQLSILATRKSGTTDVRKLSAAEAKLFTLALVLALLHFVPLHKRCNLLILDEPCSSFSPHTREKFYSFLPILLTIIPSIIVVTPDPDERMPGAREYTIVRNKKESKLVSGHPTEA